MSRIASDSEVSVDEDGASEELSDFIVDEQDEFESKNRPRSKERTIEGQPDEKGDLDEEGEDKILFLNSELKPNETVAQKLLRAHISVLVSALGGPDYTSSQNPPPYKLGHDAQACLKDLKRWIRTVDEKNSTFDVALACADSGLVVNDLTVIMCQWDRQQRDKIPIKNPRSMERIMLSCLELLVLLTWPTEMNKDMSEAQKLSYANAKKAQVIYKKHILEYNKGQTLEAVIRLVLPTIAKEKIDREPRDNAIIRLVLFFIRNVLYIEPADASISVKARKGLTNVDTLPSNITYEDISLNAVLPAFKKNKVLMFLLTMSGTLGKDLDKEAFSHTTLECIYLLYKGVKSKDILMPLAPPKAATPYGKPQDELTQTSTVGPMSTASGMQLKELLNEEAKKRSVQSQHLSSRHSRFGSLLSLRGKDSSFPISGQEALIDMNSTLDRLDSTKKWNTRSTFKYDSDEFVSTQAVFLRGQSVLVLKEFTEQFLIGGCFNNIIENISWLLSGASDLNLIHEYEKANYFLVIAWFFNYKRERASFYNDGTLDKSNLVDDADGLDFGSVGAALSDVCFILLISYFRESFSLRRWSSLHVALICFYEMLMISYSIFAKKRNENSNSLEDQEEIDREIAEGIIRKLFSFNDFLGILTKIPQTAAKHSPDYLQICISVVHILLKSFEAFANEDVKLYVQIKRKTRKLSKSKLDKNTEDSMRDLIDGSDDEFADDRVREITKERKLNFQTTEAGFFKTPTVSTYIEYLSRYEDLSHEEIKRCLSYFHRLFVSRKDYNALYRMDFIHLLYKLRSFLPKTSSIKAHVDDFGYYFMKKFKSAFNRFPNPVEVLFPRFEEIDIKTYLSTGDYYVKPESSSSKNRPRLAKEMEFIRSFDKDEKVKILVAALLYQDKQALLNWLITDLQRILEEKIPAEISIGMLKPNAQFGRLLINNPYLRLLLRLIGFELPFISEETCELPSYITSDSLAENIELIKKWNNSQPIEFEDSKDPTYFLRVKDAYEDDDADYFGDRNDSDDERIAFETKVVQQNSGRNVHELDKLDELEAALDIPKGKARIKRKRRGEATRKEPRGSRVVDGPSRSARASEDSVDVVRSAEFVHDSDDESDDEKERVFFEREERLRKLIGEIGTVVDAKSLVEFKKAWKQLDIPNTKQIPSNVLQMIDGNDNLSEKNAVANNSSSRSSSEDIETGQTPLNANDYDTSASSQDDEGLRKRKQVVLDESDSEDDQPMQVRRKVAISEDEDD